MWNLHHFTCMDFFEPKTQMVANDEYKLLNERLFDCTSFSEFFVYYDAEIYHMRIPMSMVIGSEARLIGLDYNS